MKNQSRISLFIAAKVQVIMNPMAVKGNCRIAKQQGRIGQYLACPLCIVWCLWWQNIFFIGLLCIAVDDVVDFTKSQFVADKEAVFDLDETEFASASLF